MAWQVCVPQLPHAWLAGGLQELPPVHGPQVQAAEQVCVPPLPQAWLFPGMQVRLLTHVPQQTSPKMQSVSAVQAVGHELFLPSHRKGVQLGTPGDPAVIKAFAQPLALSHVSAVQAW